MCRTSRQTRLQPMQQQINTHTTNTYTPIIPKHMLVRRATHDSPETHYVSGETRAARIYGHTQTVPVNIYTHTCHIYTDTDANAHTLWLILAMRFSPDTYNVCCEARNIYHQPRLNIYTNTITTHTCTICKIHVQTHTQLKRTQFLAKSATHPNDKHASRVW